MDRDISYKTILDNDEIDVMAYNIETRRKWTKDKWLNQSGCNGKQRSLFSLQTDVGGMGGIENNRFFYMLTYGIL